MVALGGNALVRAGGTGTWAEAVGQMRRSALPLARVVADGNDLILTHGNGPQVGMSLRQNEVAQREVPARPLDVIGAETQGQIGYLIQQELTPALQTEGVPRTVLCLVTRMLVSPKDPAFKHPTKPIGQYYDENEARLLRKSRGWELVNDSARGGWRRLVASPRPLKWVEGETVRELLDRDLGLSWVPVVGGGGGIPVVQRGGGRLEGVDAVIDKDLGAAVIASQLKARTLAIVTDVPAVAVGFRRPWERWLGAVTPSEMASYLKRGEFAEGSMGPKVEAALEFLRAGGQRAIITDATSLGRALQDETGTRIREG